MTVGACRAGARRARANPAGARVLGSSPRAPSPADASPAASPSVRAARSDPGPIRFQEATAVAGHSKWHNIKHRKAAVDAKRGKMWSKCAKAIMVAAKNGGPDPDANLTLRYAIDEAR